MYRSLVGQLNWVNQYTRPDMAFQVSALSKNLKKCASKDMRKLRKIVNVCKNERMGILLSRLEGNLEIEVYTDASLGKVEEGNLEGGFIVSIRNEKGRHCPIIWKSRCLKRIARSTIEAEALALIEGAERGMLVNEWWKEIWKTEIGLPIKVFTDSKTLHNAVGSMTKVTNMRLRVDMRI